jgi:hypothetical protein
MACHAPHRGRRPLAAYHEAGHCLARLFFGHTFDRAVVRSVAECIAGPLVDDRGREIACEGLVMGYDISSPSMTREIVGAMDEETARFQSVAAEISLIEALAGIVAEARHRRVGRAEVLLTGGDADWASATATCHRWFPDASDAALSLAEKRAAAVVLSPAGWRAVQGMAGKLLADGEMDCETAEGIFAAAYGRPVPRFGAWTDRWPPTLAMLRGKAT